MTMKFVAGIAQYQPVVLDLKASVSRACEIIAHAKKQGVRLLAFPETWLPVYPVWVDMGSFSKWDDQASKKLYARLYHNSLALGSPELERLMRACRQARIVAVVGANERDTRSKSIYNSLFFISERGELIGHHRKLVPTHGERLLWRQGDGAGLKVCETPFGNVSGLICWEHWMPLARQVLHEQAETIHVAAWPHGKERHQIASRHYAFEGRCFVLAAAMYLEKKSFPKDYELREELAGESDILLEGGSSVIGPDGCYIVEPVYGIEALVCAEIETERTLEESLTLDVGGHYSRPDIFSLTVRGRNQFAVHANDRISLRKLSKSLSSVRS